MKVESMGLAGSSPFSSPKAEDKLTEARKKKETISPEPQPAAKQQVASEELLNQIKGFSDDGAFGVRFETSDLVDQLVVKVIDQETDELIRQIPSDELLKMKASLGDLRGNLLNTAG